MRQEQRTFSERRVPYKQLTPETIVRDLVVAIEVGLSVEEGLHENERQV